MSRSIVTEHLRETDNYEKRGLRRPSMKIGRFSFSIQSGQSWYSKIEDGTEATVQLTADSEMPDVLAARAFMVESYDKALGWKDISVNTLDKELTDLISSEHDYEKKEKQKEDDKKTKQAQDAKEAKELEDKKLKAEKDDKAGTSNSKQSVQQKTSSADSKQTKKGGK